MIHVLTSWGCLLGNLFLPTFMGQSNMFSLTVLDRETCFHWLYWAEQLLFIYKDLTECPFLNTRILNFKSSFSTYGPYAIWSLLLLLHSPSGLSYFLSSTFFSTSLTRSSSSDSIMFSFSPPSSCYSFYLLEFPQEIWLCQTLDYPPGKNTDSVFICHLPIYIHWYFNRWFDHSMSLCISMH